VEDDDAEELANIKEQINLEPEEDVVKYKNTNTNFIIFPK